MAWALGSRYMVQERLGSGGMGAVYRATRHDGGPDRAVKMLRPELADNPVILARFVQERVLMLALRSPHLVVVEDLIVDGDVVAIVMELVSGGTLREHLAHQGSLSEPEALEAIRQVLMGLGVVHGHGVVHRDVKPENVLVTANPDNTGLTLKVSDFGIARLLDGPHLTGTFEYIGTLHYSAPEVAEGLTPTPATDVYAVGVMLYELLCGATPYAGGAPFAVMKKQIEQPPPRPPGISDPVWALILHWLDPGPGSRPADAWEALREINELQQTRVGSPAPEPQPGPGTATPPVFIPAPAAPVASSPGAGAFIPVGPASAVAAGGAAATEKVAAQPWAVDNLATPTVSPVAPDHLEVIHERPPQISPSTALTPPPVQATDSSHPSIVPGFGPSGPGDGQLGPPNASWPGGGASWPGAGGGFGDSTENAAPHAEPRRRKGLVFAAIGVLVAGVIGGAAVLLTGGSSAAKHYAFAFPAESYPASGVTVARTWTLTGGKHPTLHGVLDFHTSRATNTKIEEVLPSSLVADPAAVTFQPAPTVIEPGRVVSYSIVAGGGQTIQDTYDVPVPAGDVSMDTLQRWANEEMAEAGARYRQAHRLVSITFPTKAVGVVAGDTVRLTLAGTQVGGLPAPTVALAGAAYRVDDPHLATVSSEGVVKGLNPGITTVHVTLGSLTAKVALFVTVPTASPAANPNPGSVNSPGTTASAGASNAPNGAPSVGSNPSVAPPSASVGPGVGPSVGPSLGLAPSPGASLSVGPTLPAPSVNPVVTPPGPSLTVPTGAPSPPVSDAGTPPGGTPPAGNPPAATLAPSAALTAGTGSTP